MDESVHTVNAAAVVLAAAARSSNGLQRHNHHQQQLHDDHATATRKIRWWSRLKAKLCFIPHGHPRRIADDVSSSSPQPAAAYSVHHAPQPVFAFVAPPSSPATSLLHSEAPSPPALIGGHGISPRSIFSVGPYAHGPQQLVSPPVLYSAFTTEPSSASLTPPAPDLHLALAATSTNPSSSPEVPFARFLASSTSMAEAEHCGGMLQAAYQLQPGSPIPPVVSPSPCSSPRPFFRKLHRRNEGSLLDGHIPVLSTGAGVATDHDDEEGRGGGSGRDDDEVPKSGEFVFGNADDGGGAEDVAANKWPAFLPHG